MATKFGFQPLYDRVLIQLRPEEKTVGLIHIPESAGERPMVGTIVAAGEGTPMNDGSVRPLSVKVGNEVMFERFAGTELDFKVTDAAGNKVQFVVVKEEDIMGVLRGQ